MGACCGGLCRDLNCQVTKRPKEKEEESTLGIRSLATGYSEATERDYNPPNLGIERVIKVVGYPSPNQALRFRLFRSTRFEVESILNAPYSLLWRSQFSIVP